LHGPQGLRTVEQALKDAAQDPRTRDKYLWPAAERFYLFTRNLLGLRIRDSLHEIERTALSALFTHLSTTKIKVEEQVHKFKITVSTETIVDSNPFSDRITQRKVDHYAIGEPKLAELLHGKLLPAVEAHQKILELETRWKRAEERLKASRNQAPKGQSGARGGSGSQGPAGGTGGGGGSGGTGGGGEEGGQDAGDFDPSLLQAWLETVQSAAAPKYEEAFRVCPFAPTAGLRLKSGFSQQEMGEALGATIMQFLRLIEQMGAALKDSGGWVKTAIPDPKPGQGLESVLALSQHPEDVIAGIVLGNPESPLYMTLSSEDLFNQLIDDGSIAVDSLDYVVCVHYMSELRRATQAAQAQEQRLRALFGTLSKISSLISLAFFFTPLGAGARLLAAGLGVGLVLFQTYSISAQLTRLNAEVLQGALSLDLASAEALARVNELTTMRGAYLNTVTEELAKELLLMAAGSAWVPFKALLEARNFYADLETLVAEPEESQ
ncbi:MAG: hypothetical protein ABW110_08800, partial [Steroidobacteraceae bacterium]